MQARFIRHWQKMADAENIAPLEPGDFGFNYPEEYVLMTGQIFVDSGYHVMPEAGGWNDQDPLWCEDVMKYLRGSNYYRWLVKKEFDPDSKEKSYNNPVVNFNQFADWTKL